MTWTVPTILALVAVVGFTGSMVFNSWAIWKSTRRNLSDEIVVAIKASESNLESTLDKILEVVRNTNDFMFQCANDRRAALDYSSRAKMDPVIAAEKPSSDSMNRAGLRRDKGRTAGED